MAKFGQLLLQKGKVVTNGVTKEVVPTAYLEEMVTTQSRMRNDLFPMGWQVWNWGADDFGESGYCAEGLGFQSICVFSNQETVIAIQAPNMWDMTAFSANIGVRNDALAGIRNGISCTPTQSPTAQILTYSPTTMDLDANLSGNNNNNNSNNNSNNNEKDEKDENDTTNNTKGSNLNVGKDEKSSPLSVGLIIALAIAVVIIMVLVGLLCCKKKKSLERKQENDTASVPPSVVAQAVPVSPQHKGEEEVDDTPVHHASVLSDVEGGIIFEKENAGI